LYILFRTPLYSISNRINVVPAAVTGYERLAEYFPEQYNNLFLLSTSVLLEDLKSDEFAEILKERANISIQNAALKDRLYMNINQSTIVLTYIDNSPEETYMVDKELVNLFIDSNNEKY